MLIQIRQHQLFVLRAIRAAAQSVVIQEKYISTLVKLFGDGHPRKKDVTALKRANTLFDHCSETMLDLERRANRICDMVANFSEKSRACRRKASREVLKLKGKAQMLLNKVEEAHNGLQILQKRAYAMNEALNKLPGENWTERQTVIIKLGKRLANCN